VDFLPPFELIKSFITFSTVQGELTVTTSNEQFTAMIRAFIESVDVDEAWYLNQYPGIADAIRDGIVTSAKDHFLHNGYFEGRLPFLIKVDEKWYCEQNPDVVESIAAGTIESAQQHFVENGYREGRRPFPP
jgi:hypothetical protein